MHPTASLAAMGQRVAARLAAYLQASSAPRKPISQSASTSPDAQWASEGPSKSSPDAQWASEGPRNDRASGAPSKKASATGPLIAFDTLRRPVWTPRDYAGFAREGFMQNAIVYRCVRMISECTATVPLLLYHGDVEIEAHPLLDLLRRPNTGQTGVDLMEQVIGHLLVSGNAYLEAVAIGPDAGPVATWATEGPTREWASEAPSVRELHALRPDRMQVIPGPDGWPEAYQYTVGGRSVRLSGEAAPGIPRVLHLKLFHPDNDHYGMSPLEAAATAIDLHNTASQWNKALLDNAARPSGALVYTSRDGNLTSEQYERLKSELEAGFQGAANAGRPLLLEGGLDWKSMSLSPKDMDFIEARHAAAREIALALGVPPMLLGIPGDNTYANLAEAQRTFWRQTILPLAERIASALSRWLSDARLQVGNRSAGNRHLTLKPDLDQLPALAGEREALWTQLEKSSFLSLNEKRAAAGYAPLPDAELAAKFNPFHDALGRFTFGPDGGIVHPVAKRPTPPPKAKPEPTKPKTNEPQKLEDILKPGGKDVGARGPGAGDNIRTVSPTEFDALKRKMLEGAKEVPAPKDYRGNWYQRPDGTIFGLRESDQHGTTLEVVEGLSSGLKNGYKVHRK